MFHALLFKRPSAQGEPHALKTLLEAAVHGQKSLKNSLNFP